MRLRRVMMTWMLVLVALACLAPALALASGPSAGDQQYTDPLGGSNGSGSKTTSSSSGSSSSSSSSSSGSSSGSSSSASQSSSAPAVSSGSSATPVATTASSSSSSATSGTLPRTGFDLWAGVGIGVVLFGAGMTLRRRAHST